MLVVLDAIFNRITRNRTQGRNTWIVIDEIYLLFANSYSANFLFELWKRVRKYGAFCTGISQNVEDLLQSHTARTMLGNSEFLMMLNQAGSDRLELARLLSISETQLSYITNSEAGRGSMDARNPMDVVEMDERRVSMLHEVFWDMNSVTSHVSEPAPSPSPVASASPEATATAEPCRVLTVSVTSRYWDDMIACYDFTDEQIKMLWEMMSARNVVLLMQLVDSAIGRPATDWSGIIDVPEGGMDIPLYLQGDYTQTVCYIDGIPKSVSTSGCGAACVSMVIAYLTGNTGQTPYTLFKWAYDHGYYTGNGLGHSCLAKLASLYGVKGTWIENDATLIAAALRAGHPVIAHMGPGVFTTDGHYIVLRGITDDGYVLVNDPGCKSRNRYAYKLSAVVAQAKTSMAFMVCNR